VISPNRDQDQLLLFAEIAELMRLPEATLRWLRNQGRAPFLFKSGHRVVAWKSDVIAHLESERAAEQSNRASA
jgi:predicted DNA-binding transcriptional regulator AlpA